MQPAGRLCTPHFQRHSRYVLPVTLTLCGVGQGWSRLVGAAVCQQGSRHCFCNCQAPLAITAWMQDMGLADNKAWCCRVVMQGLPTIRAYGAESAFQSAFINHLSLNGSWWFAYLASSRWIGFRLDLIATVTLTMAVLLATAVRQHVSAWCCVPGRWGAGGSDAFSCRGWMAAVCSAFCVVGIWQLPSRCCPSRLMRSALSG